MMMQSINMMNASALVAFMSKAKWTNRSWMNGLDGYWKPRGPTCFEPKESWQCRGWRRNLSSRWDLKESGHDVLDICWQWEICFFLRTALLKFLHNNHQSKVMFTWFFDIWGGEEGVQFDKNGRLNHKLYRESRLRISLAYRDWAVLDVRIFQTLNLWIRFF